MEKIGLFSFLLFIAVPLKAQDTPAERPAKAIYVEGLGSGIGLAINYDTRFKPGLTGLGLRAGIGGVGGLSSLGTVSLITLPVLLNYVVGNSQASFEVGAGVTAGYLIATGTNTVTGDNVNVRGLVWLVGPAISVYGCNPSATELFSDCTGHHS